MIQIPYKDPAKQKQAMMETMRIKRAGGDSKISSVNRLPVEVRIGSAKELKDVIEFQLKRLIESDIDVAIQSRAVANLATVAIKLIEAADIESRLAKLEEAAKKPVIEALTVA